MKSMKKQADLRKNVREIKDVKKENRIESIEHALKTKFLSYLMLILASSIVLWFTSFSEISLLLWIIIAIVGGYIILNYDVFVSKSIVVLSALVMEFLVLTNFSDLAIFGSPGNILLIAFIMLDTILIYALSKL
jgi:hypothetical protein